MPTFATANKEQHFGTLADRLGNGLQNRVEQFDSARYLERKKLNLRIEVQLFRYWLSCIKVAETRDRYSAGTRIKTGSVGLLRLRVPQ